MRHSMRSISFSREEFKLGFAQIKGDNKTEHSMRSISFSDRNLIEALPLLKEKIR